MMAVPGDAVCREIAPCVAGQWGAIPVEANTVYVDISYPGNDSDGTAAKPWTTVQEGVNDAPANAIVAVAAGTYAEDVSINGTPVRLWGVCPALVEVVGTGVALGAINVAAAGSEVRDLAATGSSAGVVVTGDGVTLERLWVHDSAVRGISLTADATVRGSLVEFVGEIGVFASGADVVIEATEVRDTQPRVADLGAGRGVSIEYDTVLNVRGSATVRGCTLRNNNEFGAVSFGADLIVEGSVLRDTQAQQSSLKFGHGFGLQAHPTNAERANGILRSSYVAANREIGVSVTGSDLLVEGTVVRDTLPRASNDTFGRGIEVRADPGTAIRSDAIIRDSLVVENDEIGISITASDALIETTVVRDTAPRVADAFFGRGITVQLNVGTGDPAGVTVRSSVIDNNHESGIFVSDSTATLELVVVSNTKPTVNDTTFGDGVLAASIDMASDVWIADSLIADSHRAALTSFGSTISFGNTALRCQVADLIGAGFDDRGGNGCGCPDATDMCVVLEGVSGGEQP
jgi:hypothetical protein